MKYNVEILTTRNTAKTSLHSFCFCISINILSYKNFRGQKAEEEENCDKSVLHFCSIVSWMHLLVLLSQQKKFFFLYCIKLTVKSLSRANQEVTGTKSIQISLDSSCHIKKLKFIKRERKLVTFVFSTIISRTNGTKLHSCNSHSKSISSQFTAGYQGVIAFNG